jgi:DNA-binding transcriptional LysR family regulator
MTELRQLRYFVTVAQEGQMTRAAAKLHLAQPALSQAVSQLESRLGVELFRRHARGVSLTPAGEAYLTKASVVLAALADADLTAQAAARAASRTIEWGFIATPPMVEDPSLFGAFTAACPDASVSFRELSYPRESTASWLAQVDVALCYSPTAHPDVHAQPLRDEPRVAVVASNHPLARRRQLSVADVLDETFCGTDPALEPVRVGFWRLDDHRGRPAPNVSSDRASNPQEMMAVVASGRAISVGPAPSVRNVLNGLPGAGVVAVPLRDARPTVLTLVWRRDNPNPLLQRLLSSARALADHDGRPPVR